MDDQTKKIERSTHLIKGFMVLIVILQVVRFYETNVMDFGEIAGAVAILSLFRALLLSPSMLAAPLKSWFQNGTNLSKASYKYLVLALVLLIVSAF